MELEQMNNMEFKVSEIGLIPEDWDVKKLFEVADFIRGFSYSGSEKNSIEGEYIFITLNSVFEGGGFKKEFSYISSNRLKERHFIDFNQIFIANTEQTKTGTLLGSPALVEFPKSYHKDKGVFSHHITKVVSKSIIDKSFLYYYLIFNQERAVQYNTGSVIWALDVNSWSRNEIILLPSLTEQKAIAKILSDLDEKIEVNKRINEILEETGQTLFKRWFIDFEFPNEKGEPYKSSGGEMIESELGEIPKDWEVGSVGDLSKIQSGYAFKGQDFTEKGEVGIVKIKNISNKIVDITNTQFVNLNIVKNLDTKFKVNSGDILIAMTGAEVCKIGIVEQTNKILYLNQRVGSFKEIINKSKYYIYLLLTSEKYQQLLRDTARGSAQPNISSIDIENTQIIVPHKEIIIKFGSFFEDIFSKLIRNLAEIQTLKQTRDSLLPKLMSGEIRIKEE